MIRFEVAESDREGPECTSKRSGCRIHASRVCSQCGRYLCGNASCFFSSKVDYLDSPAERTFCPDCHTRSLERQNDPRRSRVLGLR